MESRERQVGTRNFQLPNLPGEDATSSKRAGTEAFRGAAVHLPPSGSCTGRPALFGATSAGAPSPGESLSQPGGCHTRSPQLSCARETRSGAPGENSMSSIYPKNRKTVERRRPIVAFLPRINLRAFAGAYRVNGKSVAAGGDGLSIKNTESSHFHTHFHACGWKIRL